MQFMSFLYAPAPLLDRNLKLSEHLTNKIIDSVCNKNFAYNPYDRLARIEPAYNLSSLSTL